MTWLAAIGALMKPVIIPIASALVAWFVPTPQSILAKKLAITHADEQSGKGLDTLP